MKPIKQDLLEIQSFELLKASFLFEAAIHPFRQQLLSLLCEEDRWLTATAIADLLNASRIFCMQHLSILVGVNLLFREKNEGNVFYFINEEKLEDLNAAAKALSQG